LACGIAGRSGKGKNAFLPDKAGSIGLNFTKHTINQGGNVLGRKGQGLTDYLVVFFAIVVIALFVVAVMGWLPEEEKETGEASRRYWQDANPFAVADYVLENGRMPVLVLKNNTSQTLTVESVRLGDYAYDAAGAEFAGGSEARVTLKGAALNCTRGKTYSYELEISYMKRLGSSEVALTESGTEPLAGICS
jgi:hypothetical protein